MSRPTERPALDTLERRLLDAARLERPRARARQRTVLALASGATVGSAASSAAAAVLSMGSGAGSSGAGSIVAASGASALAPTAVGSATAVGGATAALGGAKIAAGTATLLGVAKAVAVGALSGAVVLGAAQKIQEPRPLSSWSTASPVATVDVRRPAPPTERVVPTASSLGEAESGLTEPAPAEPPSVVARRTPTSTSSRARPPAALATAVAVLPPVANDDARETSSLADEVAALDRTRELLIAGDPNGALRALDDYERTRKVPRLSAEAALLRIEALLMRGDRARGAAQAAAFLLEHPESPVADRMRAIIDATPK